MIIALLAVHKDQDAVALIVCLDSHWITIAAENKANPVAKAKKKNLLYGTNTSGSTGVSKNVPITHRSMTNFIVARPLPIY
jgi:non-ribosomal peptide synthetase component F